MKYLLLITLCFAVTVKAQITENEIVNYLTNNDSSKSSSSRIWVAGDYRSSLGKSCQGTGQSWEFFNDKKVIIRECISEKTVIKKYSFLITPVEDTPGEYSITFNEPVAISKERSITSMRMYLIQPEYRKPNKIMMWSYVPDCKLCPGGKIEFKSRN